ncbi:unnamed protein product [Nezara viridula]|uniref:Uncharacterized protein n=1 Tax=Nezara viridula TaxID=85310 RepID=A0A9P0EAA4_NEZVI|nr:unnamed protein product [Nezara viridula]
MKVPNKRALMLEHEKLVNIKGRKRAKHSSHPSFYHLYRPHNINKGEVHFWGEMLIKVVAEKALSPEWIYRSKEVRYTARAFPCNETVKNKGPRSLLIPLPSASHSLIPFLHPLIHR